MVLDHADSAVHKLLDPGVRDTGLRGHLVADLRHLLAVHGNHPHHAGHGDVLNTKAPVQDNVHFYLITSYLTEAGLFFFLA